MKDDHYAQVDAAKFWIEAAHRLDFDDPERRLTAKGLDQLIGTNPNVDVRARKTPFRANRLIQFLYLRDLDFAGFVQTWIDRELSPEGEKVATQLAALWPGMTDFIEEARAAQEDYRSSPHYQQMIDLIRHWDANISSEENVRRHHLRMTAPKTMQ